MKIERRIKERCAEKGIERKEGEKTKDVGSREERKEMKQEGELERKGW